MFTIQLVGAGTAVQLNDGLFTIQTDATIREVEKTDIIIIPALYVDVEKYLDQNVDLIQWITKQYFPWC